MKKNFLTLAAALCMGLSASAQYNPDMQLPLDPLIKVGKLSNGLTYYIRHNEEPKERADFYIIYSVGALQEDANQNGLAHFLEHMAFNGTKNFPGGNSESTSIVKTLERHGLAFGRNINAYTAADRTVYYLNDIVTTDKALTDTCLLVLHDWAHYLSLEGEEIDNERGVISEEWRTRNNASSRMRKQWYPMVFGDSKYTTHDVIGDYDIINNFKYEELRDFYYKWYRTDQQAVAVVGDVDVEYIENKIKEIFSEIPAVENPAPKEPVILPENEEPLYTLATDKEQTVTAVQVMMVRPRPHDNTVGGFRNQMVQSFYNSMLKQRISDKITAGDPYLIGASASVSGLIQGYETYAIAINAKPGMDKEGLDHAYREVVRAKRFGFTEPELNRLKLNALASLENTYKQRDKISNSSIVSEIVSVFAYDDVSMNIEDYYKLEKALINDITLAEINKYASENPDFKNVKILVTGQSGTDYAFPTKDDILGVIAAVDADNSIEPYSEGETGSGLIDHEVVAGKIVKEKVLPVYDARMWTLSNGANVVYAKASHDKDVVTLTSNSYGGNSLYPVEKLKAAALIEQIPSLSGVGRFNSTDLKKALAGKKAGAGISVGDNGESVSGSSTATDFETMMQLVYLRFVEPRFDSTRFYTVMANTAIRAEPFQKTPDFVMKDSLVHISYNNHPRINVMRAEDYRNANLKEVEELYRDRISDASDFTFFITGDIDEDIVKPMVEKYIGSIPSTYRKEKYKDHKVEIAKGYTERKVVIPFETPKAIVLLQYSEPGKVCPKNNLMFGVMKSILSLRYTANIREKEGGTYGVSSSANVRRVPSERLNYTVQFETEPAKAAHLKDLVYAEIEDIAKNGVTEDELANTVKNMLKNREQSKDKSNAWVANTVSNYVLYGENNNDPKNFENILNNMKPSDIQKFAAKYFKKADLVDIIFANSFE